MGKWHILAILVIGFSIITVLSISAEESLIPSWIKNTAKFWVEGDVSDNEFINAITWMIDNKILKVTQQSTVNDEYFEEYKGWANSEITKFQDYSNKLKKENENLRENINGLKKDTSYWKEKYEKLLYVSEQSARLHEENIEQYKEKISEIQRDISLKDEIIERFEESLSDSYRNSISSDNLLQDSYLVYIEPLPEWATFAGNAVYDAVTLWEKHTDIKFYEASIPEEADVYVKFVKNFGDDTAGHTIYQRFVEIGVGDDYCHNRWQSYDPVTISSIAQHEFGHVLGLDDDYSDSSLVMYYQTTYMRYALDVDETYHLGADEILFLPVCSRYPVTSYAYQVNSDDPNGFDVYFVESKNEYDNYAAGKQFYHYSDKSCFGEGYVSYGDTCQGVANTGGLIIAMPKQLKYSTAEVTVKLQEIWE